MRNLKKFLALVLAMVMAMSLLITADAKTDNKYLDYPDESGIINEFEEAVAVLTGMKVFKGDDNGNFNPDSTITRAEVAAIIYRLVTADVNDNQANLYRNVNHGFVDVTAEKWYAGYVGYLWNAQIIKGVDGSHFAPSSTVTGYQALAMILRAVGYDKQGEFTGPTWQINVASIAQQKGILADVNKTNYNADTLYNPARRDVVASLLFRTAAYVPMVQWTSAFSYQETGMTGGVVGTQKNPSLGEKNFGLACNTGIVVANQYTGENSTKIGYSAKAVYDSSNLVRAEYTGVSYLYGTSQDITSTSTDGHVSIAYKFKTDLDYFGHKVNVWYDNRSSTGSVSFGEGAGQTNLSLASDYSTYTVFDKADKVATVFANDGTANAASGDNTTSIYTAAVAKGFSKNWGTQYESDQYYRMNAITTTNVTDASEVGLYRVISNSGGAVDVIISLNQEVARITQRNSTIKDGEYIYLGRGDSYFGGKLNGADNGGLILDDDMVPENDKTLGHLVTATEIYDTTKNVKGDHKIYQTEELKAAFTGTVTTYIASRQDPTKVLEVTLSSTEQYGLSGISSTDTVWSGFGAGTSYDHLINGAVGKLLSGSIIVGTSYSFYTDEAGRFIGVSAPSEYEFMYATFADYEIGSLGTGTIGYHAYGVDWDGKKIETTVNRIILPYRASEADEYQRTTFEGFSNISGIYGNLGLQYGYNLLPITVKDQGTNSVWGNGIVEGANTQFGYNSDGTLTAYNDGVKDWGTQFWGWDSNGDGYIDSNDSPVWTITSSDAANGFKRVYVGSTDYLLTNETQFTVVTGAGTSDLNAEVFKGMDGLLNGSNGLEIDPTQIDNIYFLTDSTTYGNTDVNQNRTITKVIMGDTNLLRYTNSSLFFAAPGSEALLNVQLAGATTDVKQYMLYNNGVVGYYWVDTSITGTDEPTDTTTDGDFYTLAQIKTINGQPIYRATRVTGKGNAVNQQYNYIVVNNVNTAEIQDLNTSAKNIYKVGGAKVAEAFGTNTPVIVTNNINTVEKLNHAVSMGIAGSRGDLYDIQVAIVYSGLDVSCIYVTDITAHY